MKMSVTQKMILLVATAIFGIVGLAVFNQNRTSAIYEATNYGNVHGVPSILALNKAMVEFGRLRVRIYRHALNSDAGKMAEIELSIKEAQEGITKAFKEYESLLSDDKDKQMFADDMAAYNDYANAIDPLLTLSRVNKHDEAQDELTKNAASAERLNKALDAHLQYNAELAKKGSDEAFVIKDSAATASTTLALLLVLTAAALGFFITRNLMRELGGEPEFVANLANKIAAGDFTTQIDVKAGDTTSIMAEIKNMNEALKKLLAQMEHMSAEHDKGDIDMMVDSHQFQGSFKTMAEGVNTMVGGHIAVKKKAMAVFKAFGEGDFDAPMEKLPGKKAFINDTVELVRGNLKGFIADMNHMSQQHDLGDIDVFMDAGKFKGDFGVMATGVNNMVGGHIAVKKKAMAVFKAFGEGNFDAPMEKLPGKKAFINDTVELVRGNLKGFIADMNHMSQQHDLGDIDVFMDAGKFQGDFAVMAKGVNEMVAGHIAVKKKAMACVQQFGEGNLDAPMEQLPGKKAFINHTIEQLRGNLKQIVSEIRDIVAAANRGDFSVKMELKGKQGFTKELSELLNQWSDTVDTAFKDTIAIAEALEQGDLTRTVTRDYQGAYDQVKQNLNNTVAKISQTIGEVISASNQLANAAEQISATSQSLSQSSSEQAAGVEETSASIEQMAASINQNSDNAKITDGMAAKASKEAVEGGDAVKQTVEAMKSIAAKIGIIDDIAYQTNMLALNAAIEAARAGDHGKGFAVVAAEVRKLAERSQIAAQEIGELATSSVNTAESAGKLLDEIVPSIAKTSDLVQEIAAASNEQAAGVSQVNHAMNQMNQITQQNAAASEQLAATAEEMTGQTEQLQSLMSFFRLASGNSAAFRAQLSKQAIKIDKKPRAKQSVQASGNGLDFDMSKFDRF